MKIFVQRDKYSGLQPFGSISMNYINKFKENDIFEVSIKKARNPAFHKKGMALFNIGFQNCKWDPPSFDFYRRYITIKAGFYESAKVKEEWIFQAKSLAFDKMDDLEFEQVYKAVLQEIIYDIEADEETIEKELMNFF